MTRTGRPKTDLTLTDGEREQLVRWSRRRKSSQALVLRSRIVLECAGGDANTVVAQRLGVGRQRSGSGGPGSWSIALTVSGTIPALGGRQR